MAAARGFACNHAHSRHRRERTTRRLPAPGIQQRGLPAHAWSGSRTGELFGYPLQVVELTDADAVAGLCPGCTRRGDPRRRHRENPRLSPRPRPSAPRQWGGDGSFDRPVPGGASAARYVSTDLVFDGRRENYREDDGSLPLSMYGR